MLPDCLEGQLIGVNPDKTLTCVSAVSGMITPPTCLPGTQALTSTLDVVSGKNVLSCVNKGTGSNDVTITTRIMNAQTGVTDLQTRLNAVATGGGNRAKYVGASPTPTYGELFPLVNGVPDTKSSVAGPAGGSGLCSVSFPGSHMCNPYELYESVVTAVPGDPLDGTKDVGPLMVYMQAWVLGFGLNSVEFFAGLSENCGAGTYPTGDAAWKNTEFNFKVPATGGTVRVPQFNASVGCAATRALACCK
jgi:hypothetical protein